MTTFRSFSERFALLRARLGLKSFEALAERIGYSRTYLHAVESDPSHPSEKFLARLAALEMECGLGLKSEHFAQPGEEPGEERRTLSVGGPYSSRVMDEPSEPRPGGAVARSDAEIAGLAALLSEHAAQVSAGARSGELPVVKRALELALEKRGVLPRGGG